MILKVWTYKGVAYKKDMHTNSHIIERHRGNDLNVLFKLSSITYKELSFYLNCYCRILVVIAKWPRWTYYNYVYLSKYLWVMVAQEWFIVYIVYYIDAGDMRDYFGKLKFTFGMIKYLDIYNLYIFILCSVCVKLPCTNHYIEYSW